MLMKVTVFSEGICFPTAPPTPAPNSTPESPSAGSDDEPADGDGNESGDSAASLTVVSTFAALIVSYISLL
jgi:hypothetical protein